MKRSELRQTIREEIKLVLENKLQLVTNINYLRDIVKINQYSGNFRDKLNGILDNIEKNNKEISPRQLDVLEKHVIPNIKTKKL